MRPKFLEPRLKLFLSADIIGSTALKQQGSAEFAEEVIDQKWFRIIQGFYVTARRAFTRQWQITSDHCEAPETLGEPPRLWKTLGDEILFVKDLSDHRQVSTTVGCWIRALPEIRAFLQKDGAKLDVKCTVWTAGFPLLNKEIVVSGWEENDLSDPEDYFRFNGDALNQFYSNNVNSDVVVDYIGPSIDIGFRLASLADERRFVVSVDVAYIVSITMPAAAQFIGRHNLRFDGSRPLKGVLSGSNYPVFWVDVGGKLPTLEDKLTGSIPCGRDEVIEYCEQFYDDHKRFMFRPFISSSVGGQLTKAPPAYDATVDTYVENYLSGDVVLEEPPPEGVETPADAGGSAELEAVAKSLSADATGEESRSETN